MKLETFLPVEDVENYVRSHVNLQMGCYFSEKQNILSGLFCTSSWIDDYYWNTFCSFKESNPQKVYEVVSENFKKKNRSPAFYIDVTCTPKSMMDFLLNKGFSYEKEIWMVFDRDPLIQDVPNLNIIPVNETDKEEFLKIFSISFGGESTTADGYGDIPPTYLSSLKDSLSGNAINGVEHNHFIAKLNDKTVGCGSIHVGNKYAGLYNVGTLPDYRGKGIGSAISVKAFKTAEEKNIKKVFFQTQPGGSVQKFYEGLGCKVVFEAALFYTE